MFDLHLWYFWAFLRLLVNIFLEFLKPTLYFRSSEIKKEKKNNLKLCPTDFPLHLTWPTTFFTYCRRPCRRPPPLPSHLHLHLHLCGWKWPSLYSSWNPRMVKSYKHCQDCNVQLGKSSIRFNFFSAVLSAAEQKDLCKYCIGFFCFGWRNWTEEKREEFLNYVGGGISKCIYMPQEVLVSETSWSVHL